MAADDLRKPSWTEHGLMARISSWSMLSTAGGLRETAVALAEQRCRPGPLPGSLEEQLDRLLDGLEQGGLSGCLIATTKADCALWADGLLGEDDGRGGPVWLCRQLTARLACPCTVVSVACASGPAALGEAVRRLALDHRGRWLVLGIDRHGAFVRAGFAALGALDPQGARPFDAERAGLALGETMAALVVQADDAPGVQVAGWGASCDANHLTGPSRDGAGLATACGQACGDLVPDLVPDLVIAHGTGTRFNDDSEALAYGSRWPQSPVVGWKGGLGHSLGACGVSELALGCGILAGDIALPGTQGLAQQGCAGPVRVLEPGAHPWRPQSLCSANAGFGGLNAAIALLWGTALSESESQAISATKRWETHIDGQGWHGSSSGTWDKPVETGLPMPSARELFGAPDTSWGRLDRSCRLLVALLAKSPVVAANSALVLLSEQGCGESDRRFEYDRRRGITSRQRFPYTLPSTPLGEASIRHRLTGPAQVLMGAAPDEIDACVRGFLLSGAPAVLLARIESEGPGACASLACWQPG